MLFLALFAIHYFKIKHLMPYHHLLWKEHSVYYIRISYHEVVIQSIANESISIDNKNFTRDAIGAHKTMPNLTYQKCKFLFIITCTNCTTEFQKGLGSMFRNIKIIKLNFIYLQVIIINI